MLSLSNLLCDYQAGNESLRYGHQKQQQRDGVPKPVVVWAVTKACNLRCVHCYAQAKPQAEQGELTFDEGRQMIDDLKSFGVPALLFSGGEPLVRSDTPELIGYAISKGLSATLSTNGLLIDDAMAARLAKLGLRYVGISLDGHRAQHDKLRGQVGAYDQTLAAIDRCKAHGLRVGVRYTIHALNLEGLDSIFSTCLDHQVDRLCVYHLAYSGRGKNMQEIDLSPEQTRAAMDRLFTLTHRAHQQAAKLEVLTVGNSADAAYLLMYLERNDPDRAQRVKAKLQGTGGNRSGCNIASIDPTGGVHYDQFSWHYNVGNIRQQPFSTIWANPTDPRLKILRDRTAYLPHRCQVCKFLSMCDGNLRSRAEAATGDWLGVDPACYLTEQEILMDPYATAALVEFFADQHMPFTD